jgi:hypothetical protein
MDGTCQRSQKSLRCQWLLHTHTSMPAFSSLKTPSYYSKWMNKVLCEVLKRDTSLLPRVRALEGPGMGENSFPANTRIPPPKGGIGLRVRIVWNCQFALFQISLEQGLGDGSEWPKSGKICPIALHSTGPVWNCLCQA